ncbi:MAG: hypothetical protein LBL64_10030 [Treponema sp.]|jgi:hypothetical protein|nr:hypothetical protein [Treponema sp.]
MSKNNKSGENNELELSSAAQGGAPAGLGNENGDNPPAHSNDNDDKDKDKDKKKDQEGPKIGLFRFLQLSPQKKGTEALLFSKYKFDVKTREQWEKLISDLLSQKIK